MQGLEAARPPTRRVLCPLQRAIFLLFCPFGIVADVTAEVKVTCKDKWRLGKIPSLELAPLKEVILTWQEQREEAKTELPRLGLPLANHL